MRAEKGQPTLLPEKRPARLNKNARAVIGFIGAVVASALVMTVFWVLLHLFGWFPIQGLTLEELGRTFLEFLIVIPLVYFGTLLLKRVGASVRKRKRRKG